MVSSLTVAHPSLLVLPVFLALDRSLLEGMCLFSKDNIYAFMARSTSPYPISISLQILNRHDYDSHLGSPDESFVLILATIP